MKLRKMPGIYFQTEDACKYAASQIISELNIKQNEVFRDQEVSAPQLVTICARTGS